MSRQVESGAREMLARTSPPAPVEVVSTDLVRSARLELRPLAESDREAYCNVVHASREHFNLWAPLHNPDESDGDLFERQLRLTRRGDADGTAWRRIAIVDDEIIGSFNLNSITRGLSFEADCNCWLASGATGQGYATEGLRALLDVAFKDLPSGLGLHGVRGGIRPDNERSISLARRVGFRREGEVRSYLQAGGEWQLHDHYLCTPEWYEASKTR